MNENIEMQDRLRLIISRLNEADAQILNGETLLAHMTIHNAALLTRYVLAACLPAGAPLDVCGREDEAEAMLVS